MPKIVAVKFLKVTWLPAKDYKRTQYEENDNQMDIGLVDTLVMMENLIAEHLKQGWSLKGEMAYVNQYRENNRPTPSRTHLVQTIVKYEDTETIDLFSSSLNQIAESNLVTEDLLEINM